MRYTHSLPFLLTCLYGHNDSRYMVDLWASLRSLAREVALPWVIMGNFNCLLFNNENVRGILFRFLSWPILKSLFMIVALLSFQVSIFFSLIQTNKSTIISNLSLIEFFVMSNGWIGFLIPSTRWWPIYLLIIPLLSPFSKKLSSPWAKLMLKNY